MKTAKTLLAALAAGLLSAAPLQARSGATWAEERFKSEVNAMVREVEAAPDPAAKRAVLAGFTARMELALARALLRASLEEEDRVALERAKARIQAYRAELDGHAGFARVPDGELDRFAAYVQQDMEQAQWGGGVYISAGALIVIVLLLVLLL